jgi:transcriptional regulator with XRE-family HTH domain
VINHSEVASRLRELRELARVTIQDAAAVVGVSCTRLWKVEHDYSKLTDRQIELLEAFYAPKVNERLKRVSRSLGA